MSWLWSTWTAWRSDNTRAQHLINTGFDFFYLPLLLFPSLLGSVQPIWMSLYVIQWECSSTLKVGMQNLAHFLNLQPLLSSVLFLFWHFLCQTFLPNPWGHWWDFNSFEIMTYIFDNMTSSELCLSLPYTPSRRKNTLNFNETMGLQQWQHEWYCVCTLSVLFNSLWSNLLWWFYQKVYLEYEETGWWKFTFYWIYWEGDVCNFLIIDNLPWMLDVLRQWIESSQ